MPTPNQKVRFLALGDSYTIGEKVKPSENWPSQLSRKIGAAGFSDNSPRIIATTGWTTGDLLKAMKNLQKKETYDLISIAIGVNNQYDGGCITEYQADLKEIFSKAIRHCSQGEKGVFGLSIPDYSITPFGKEKKPDSAKEVEKFNHIFKDTCRTFSVSHFNITPISKLAETDLSLLAEDQLHPSGKMYQLWVEDILFAIRAKLKAFSY